MKQHHFLLAGLILSWYFSCKPEVIVEPVPPSPGNLVVEATVPAKVWDNAARVYLDASRTNTMNGKRELTYNWSFRQTPPGASVNMLRDGDKPLAMLDSPFVQGTYDIELLVADKNNPGLQGKATYRLEVLPDTLYLYPPRADAGDDVTITAPNNRASLSGMGTYYINPIGRPQKYTWSVVTQPPSSPPVEILQPINLVTDVLQLVEGGYTFRLEVRNEKGLTAFDTVRVTVLPDPLKGTIKLFTEVEWQKVEITDWGWGPSTEVFLYLTDPSFSMQRNTDNTVVRVWIDSLGVWSAPNGYDWYVVEEGLMKINYPYIEDQKTYLKDVGKKTKVEVRFR